MPRREKLPRINLAFTKELHDYVTTMARARGETMTAFIWKVLTEHMESHKDLYDQAREFRQKMGDE